MTPTDEQIDELLVELCPGATLHTRWSWETEPEAPHCMCDRCTGLRRRWYEKRHGSHGIHHQEAHQ